jgi:hypothetical protein
MTVMHVTANDVNDSHATAVRVEEPEPESEVPVYHNQLNHLEAPHPKKPVSPLLLQDIPRVKVPDRGFRATLRKLSPSERSYIKSGVPARKLYKRVDEDLLFVGKYKDPRSRDFRLTPEELSSLEEDDSVRSPVNESPPPQISMEGEDALSLGRRVHEASITNLHGWYPGKRFYAEAEVEGH